MNKRRRHLLVVLSAKTLLLANFKEDKKLAHNLYINSPKVFSLKETPAVGLTHLWTRSLISTWWETQDNEIIKLAGRQQLDAREYYLQTSEYILRPAGCWHDKIESERECVWYMGGEQCIRLEHSAGSERTTEPHGSNEWSCVWRRCCAPPITPAAPAAVLASDQWTTDAAVPRQRWVPTSFWLPAFHSICGRFWTDGLLLGDFTAPDYHLFSLFPPQNRHRVRGPCVPFSCSFASLCGD